MMHIERNVYDKIIRTLLGIEGKTKDTKESRLDLEDMGIRESLHMNTTDLGSGSIPPTCFTMILITRYTNNY